MNNKGQDALEYLLLIGGGVLVAIVLALVITSIPDADSNKLENAAENFCQAWAEERGFTHLEANYSYFFPGGQQVDCMHSSNADVFDGGVSAGTREHKYFDISEEALLEWAKTESKDCCEVC